LRLRDIGGIIVVDFIDMESRGNRDKVLQELRAHLGRDRARTKAFAVSELGLIEMTRQRVRPSLWHSMTAECPTCNGTGRVFRPEVVVRRMERSLKRAGAEHKERQLAVRLHPDVALYLVEQEPNFLRQLEQQPGLELEGRAEPGVTVKVPLLAAEPGSKVTFDQVLLASDGKQVHAGKPVVKGAKVTAEIVRHGKGKKIKIYRFARRTGYRRHGGHRQQFTE